MEIFKNKISQKERQLNYYYSKKGQDTYKDYYLKNKDKIASYAKEYRKQKIKDKEEKDKKKKEKPSFEIKYGSFVVHFD